MREGCVAIKKLICESGQRRNFLAHIDEASPLQELFSRSNMAGAVLGIFPNSLPILCVERVYRIRRGRVLGITKDTDIDHSIAESEAIEKVAGQGILPSG